MGLVDDVNGALKDAMRAKDKERLVALRGIRAAIIEAQKSGGGEVDDDAVQGILRKLAKSRQESIAAYQQGGREDLVAAEEAELAVIEAFLPALADEDTVRGWAQAAIADLGASSMADMGKVMGQLKAQHGAVLDGRMASQVVRSLLG